MGIDKPEGMVTRALDNTCQRILGDDGVGHIGTLDPQVTGVVVLAVGQARKLIRYVEDGKQKSYAACVRFGTETETDDAEGAVIRRATVPERLRDATYAQEVLSSFEGTIEQVPPRYSAIKVNGVRAYDLARAGVDFALPPRTVEVFEARLVGVEATAEDVCWNCDFNVSGGTYIRALARDIGRRAQSAAHLGKLRRTASGRVRANQCVSLERLEELGIEGLDEVLLDPVRLLGLGPYELDEREFGLAQHGVAFEPRPTTQVSEGTQLALVREGRLYGVWHMDNGMLRSQSNCPGGVEGVRG